MIPYDPKGLKPTNEGVKARDIPAFILAKPARLQFMHFDGTNASAISTWLRRHAISHEVRDSSITFDTTHGALEAWIGDYVVRFETANKWMAMTAAHFAHATEEIA